MFEDLIIQPPAEIDTPELDDSDVDDPMQFKLNRCAECFFLTVGDCSLSNHEVRRCIRLAKNAIKQRNSG